MCVILLSHPFPVVLWLKIISQSGHCLRMGKERTRERISLANCLPVSPPFTFLCVFASVWLCVQEQLHNWTQPNPVSKIQTFSQPCVHTEKMEVMMIHFKQNDLSDPGRAEAQSQSAALCWNQTSFCAEYWTLLWFWDWDPAWHHVMGSSLITHPQRGLKEF